jgi:hypothetical protein
MTTLVQEQILVAIVGPASAETALRHAFDEAESRGAAVRVVAAGPASAAHDDFVRDLVERWAEKYPVVPVSTAFRRQVDAAVTLVAATRHCASVFVPASPDPTSAAVLRALTRRAHCPIVVVDG